MGLKKFNTALLPLSLRLCHSNCYTETMWTSIKLVHMQSRKILTINIQANSLLEDSNPLANSTCNKQAKINTLVNSLPLWECQPESRGLKKSYRILLEVCNVKRLGASILFSWASREKDREWAMRESAKWSHIGSAGPEHMQISITACI